VSRDPDANVTVCSEAVLENAPESMLVTFAGISMLDNLEAKNAVVPILVSRDPVSNVTVCREAPKNALSPIVVTFAGISMIVTPDW
jgi:hypothetical protein